MLTVSKTEFQSIISYIKPVVLVSLSVVSFCVCFVFVVFVVDVVVYLHYRDPVKVNACVIGILHSFEYHSLHVYIHIF